MQSEENNSIYEKLTEQLTILPDTRKSPVPDARRGRFLTAFHFPTSCQ